MTEKKTIEIYQGFMIEYTNIYYGLVAATNRKYLPMYGGKAIPMYWWSVDTNNSYAYPDFEYKGDGIFAFYINRLDVGIGSVAYNELQIKLDLSPIYKPLPTPYINGGNGDFTYTIADYKYCYGVNGYGNKIYKRYGKAYMPHYITYLSNGSIMPLTTDVALGPKPTIKKLNPIKPSITSEWNVDYKHCYIGPTWQLDEYQTYGEYYARTVYWWDDEHKTDIDKLITLSRKYNGLLIGFIPDENNNKEYVQLLLSLINYYIVKDGSDLYNKWICDPDVIVNCYYNFYGTKIICDDNTRGLVIDIPRTRHGPVGKLFLPFINTSIVYTPTLKRCDFEHFLWYFVPWEIDNAIKYLMLTDADVAEDNGYKVKVHIATRRGHTRDDMPHLSDDDLELMNCFWGFGYHHRLDPRRLFNSSITLNVDSLKTFDKSEFNLFTMIYMETGVLFPIDGNIIEYKSGMGGLIAEITFCGPRTLVYFMPVKLSVIILDKSANINTLFNNEKIIYGPGKDGWFNDVDRNYEFFTEDNKYDTRTVTSIEAYSYYFNVDRQLIGDGFITNYGMLKLFKTNDDTNMLPEVQVRYLTDLLNEIDPSGIWFYMNEDGIIPPRGLININKCIVLYNGPNDINMAGIYYKPFGLKYILVLKPYHQIYVRPYAGVLNLTYED